MEDNKVTEVVTSSNIPEASSGDSGEKSNTELVASWEKSKSGSLERYLNTKPIVAFGLTLQSSWEAVAVTFQASLLNGGPASMIYGMILAITGSSAMALSMAEMASMDPVVGAQYRWTALYAPRIGRPEFWSLMQGWLTVIAWIASCALTPFILGTIVQGLIVFNYDTYVFERWHGTLLSWVFVLIPVLWNIYARRLLVILELIGGVCHILFFICQVTVLAVLATRSTNGFVWNTLIHDVSGWENQGVAFSIGLLSVVFPLSGFDGILHMSAEVKDPVKRVPRSMVLTVVINSVFAYAFIICLLYTIGDLEAVQSSPTGYPIIEVYYLATKSKAGTNLLMVMIIIVSTIGCFSIFASVTRLVWAFARDKGLPYSDFFAYIHPELKIPVNALGLVSVMCCLLALINIGSTTAFYAVLSLTTLSLYISYVVPITLIMIRKIEGRHPAYGPFNLGRWGIPINLFAILYGIYIIFFMSFPVSIPVTATGMNYAAPVWWAAFIFAIGNWLVVGRKKFKVPVRKDDVDDPLNED